MPQAFPYSDRDLDVLARTLFGEARGEPYTGQIAVAWVIRNRASRYAFVRGSLGKDGAVDLACTSPWQFSCWWDEQAPILKSLPSGKYGVQLEVAKLVLTAGVPDPTQGADHYHTIARPSYANTWPPAWAHTMRETARIGAHVFYNSLLEPDRMLRIGMAGDDVKELQTDLGAYYRGEVDGEFGPATHAAVCSFQEAHDLTVDGVVGPVTAKALGLRS